MRLFEIATPTPPLAQDPLGSVLERSARAAGIVGVELAQLLAQCHVETAAFQTLKELPNKWQQHYEPPSKTAKMLGNTQPGDGKRFVGRGFIQVTGRYNYNQFAQNSGIDVVSSPELLERPETAAKATVDFWLNRVRPSVKDFSRTDQVTRIINHAKKGAGERKQAFNTYASKLPEPVKTQLAQQAQPEKKLAQIKQTMDKQQAAAPKATTQPVKPQQPPKTAPVQQGDALAGFMKLRGLD
jgi:hypothetical protein